MTNLYKIYVGVPVSHADKIRKVLNKYGAGHYKNYDFASFSIKGTGRFRPLTGAKPAIGKIGELEEVEEEQIQAIVEKENLKRVLEELRHAHPYEEPPIEVVKLENV